jgi:hypothetical protein
MIHITQIIQYLRTQFPTWNIDGAVEQAVAEDQSRIKPPSMFVGLGRFDATTVSRSTFQQDYVERFVILTCTPLTPNDDRTGKYAQDFVLTAREMLMQTLVNYKNFDVNSHSIHLVSDEPKKLDRARYWHEFTFKIEGTIDPNDVTPISTDYFDKLFVDYVVEPDATDDTPPIEQEIKPIYFTPG